MDASSSLQTTEISRVSGSIEFNLDTATEADNSRGDGGKKFCSVQRVRRILTWSNIKRILLRKSCAVYSLIIGVVWLIHTIPIILFFATNAQVRPGVVPKVILFVFFNTYVYTSFSLLQTDFQQTSLTRLQV